MRRVDDWRRRGRGQVRCRAAQDLVLLLEQPDALLGLAQNVEAELCLGVEGLRTRRLPDGLPAGEWLERRVVAADLSMDGGVEPNDVRRVVD